MYIEDILNRRRQIVSENIQKGFSSEFDSDELEKGKWNVGDQRFFHGNMHYVAELKPDGSPRWRRVKKTSGGSDDSSEASSTSSTSTTFTSSKIDSSKPTSSVPKKSNDKKGNIPTNVEEALCLVKIDKDKITFIAKRAVNLAYWKEDLERVRYDTTRYENNLKNAIKDGDLDKIQRTAKEYGDSKLYQEEYTKELNIRKKEKKDFLNSTGNDFTEKEVEEYLSKYLTEKDPKAVVNNKWSYYGMGSIGSTSATIRIGNGKEKSFDLNDTPSWRPIGLLNYTIRSPYGDSEVNIPIQSWRDIKDNISSTENFYLDLYKHPKQ